MKRDFIPVQKDEFAPNNACEMFRDVWFQFHWPKETGYERVSNMAVQQWQRRHLLHLFSISWISKHILPHLVALGCKKSSLAAASHKSPRYRGLVWWKTNLKGRFKHEQKAATLGEFSCLSKHLTNGWSSSSGAPDLERRGEPGLFCLPCRLFSLVVLLWFLPVLPKIKEGGRAPFPRPLP